MELRMLLAGKSTIEGYGINRKMEVDTPIIVNKEYRSKCNGGTYLKGFLLVENGNPEIEFAKENTRELTEEELKKYS